MSTFLTLLKIEGKLVWKGIDILIFGICFPIILATLFGYLLSKESTTGASSFELSYAARNRSYGGSIDNCRLSSPRDIKTISSNSCVTLPNFIFPRFDSALISHCLIYWCYACLSFII